MVLADGSDLEDDERVDDFGELESESVLSCSFAWIFFLILEGSVRPLPPCDRSSLLAEEVFCLIS